MNPRDILKLLRKEPNFSILKATGSSTGDHIMSKLRYKKPDNSAAVKALGVTALLGAGKNAVVTKALRSAANKDGMLIKGHDSLPDLVNSGLKSMGRLALHDDPYTAYGGMAALGAGSGVASALLLKPLINKARQNMSKVSSIASPISEYYSRALPEELVKQAFANQLLAKMPYSRAANVAKGVALGGAGLGAASLAYRNRIMGNIDKFKQNYDDVFSKGNKVYKQVGKDQYELADASTRGAYQLTGINASKADLDYNVNRGNNIRAYAASQREALEKQREALLQAEKNYSTMTVKGFNPDGTPMQFPDMPASKLPEGLGRSMPDDVIESSAESSFQPDFSFE
jgi:hypothetical protein